MDSWILRKRFADETDSEAEPEASGIAGEDVPPSSVSAVSVFSSPAASQGLVAGLRRSARVAATQASPAALPAPQFLCRWGKVRTRTSKTSRGRMDSNEGRSPFF